ncbi:hypothetical protein EJ08DRAFT_171652 [Tothia fuscella]|uniref:Uncharacterized protein n=1 Tax=Tothia fuscella TaxID=1048955 RepID=A0A9P4NDJ1_9PEZI|nr:hypothetical protein EJ08DRAFT_171652 [Tothia fuscella]
MASTTPWLWDTNRLLYYYWKNDDDCYVYSSGLRVDRSGREIPGDTAELAPDEPRTRPNENVDLHYRSGSNSSDIADLTSSLAATSIRKQGETHSPQEKWAFASLNGTNTEEETNHPQSHRLTQQILRVSGLLMVLLDNKILATVTRHCINHFPPIRGIQLDFRDNSTIIPTNRVQTLVPTHHIHRAPVPRANKYHSSIHSTRDTQASRPTITLLAIYMGRRVLIQPSLATAPT